MDLENQIGMLNNDNKREKLSIDVPKLENISKVIG